MALTILNNIAAIAAENQLNITSNNLQSTLEQLSSGSRINSGADDPAGLAIANGLSANIAALTQSSANATGGIGELQVADGALSQVTTLLNRAVTLATESATGTVSDEQRIALDNEYQSIKTEINSIGSTTNYNGGQVFTANTLNVFLGDGSATGSSLIGVTTGTLSANGLNLGGPVAATGTLSQTAGTPAVAATDTLTGAAPANSLAAEGTFTISLTGPTAGQSVDVGGTTYNFVTALTGGANQVVLGTGGGANQQTLINLAAAINNTSGGVGVEFGGVTAANASVTAGTATATTLAVTANQNGTAGNAIVLTSGGTDLAVTGAGTLGGAGATQVGTAGSTVAVGGKTYTFVQNLSATPTAYEVLGGGAAGTGVEATALSNLVLAVNQGTGSGTNYGAGTTQNTQVSAGPSTGTTVLFTANNAGTSGNTISGVSTGAGAFGTLDFAGGANATAAPVVAAGDSVTVGNQTYTFVAALTTPTANQTQVLVGANEVASLTNLVNAVNGGSGLGESYAYGSTVGADATAGVNPSASAAFSVNATTGLDQVLFTALTKGTVGNTIATSQAGSGDNTFSGALMTGGAAGSVNDLLTQTDAQSALSLIDGAVAAVAALRGNIGATVNRLQSASNVINNQTQNLTAAENNVTAADIPTAVANLTQFSILEQTGISALAQANQQQQLVLKLLT
ncbi:MAG: flagellin [Terriglobales bacterium]